MQHFYFDHNATTPIAPEVLEAVSSCLGQVYGNASSIHYFGQIAKQRLEAARRQVADFISCAPAELVFTSGGTEANNLAILGVMRAAARRAAHDYQRHRTSRRAWPMRPTGARGRRSDAPARGFERHRRSGRCTRGAAARDRADLRDARQQRIGNDSACRRNREDRA